MRAQDVQGVVSVKRQKPQSPSRRSRLNDDPTFRSDESAQLAAEPGTPNAKLMPATYRWSMLFDSYHCFTPQDFVFKIAQTQLELEGYWALRRAIFCQEQGIFHESDQDTVDERAIPIVCASLVAGMEDLVVGVVRIDEREPGLWYGIRLGVAEEFRSIKKLNPGGAERNAHPALLVAGVRGTGRV